MSYTMTAALVSVSGLSISARFLRGSFRQFATASTTTKLERGNKEPALVNGAWLEPRLGTVKVFDATWFLPAAHGSRNADMEFLEKRIPTAYRFDLDRLADPAEKDLPHMLPPLDWFGEKMDALGVSPTDAIVVYDTIGQFSAARAFWTLYVLGGHNVKLLDGGFPLWLKENRKVESGPVKAPKANPPGTWKKSAIPRLDQVVKRDAVEEFAQAALKGSPIPTKQLVDARPKGRFTAADPEPRPGLKRGRIPGSSNVPFKEILNEDGTFKNKQALQEIFTKAGLDVSGSKQIMTSCGSGTTAAILTFALQEILGVEAPLYDGSFAEWGKSDANRPVI